MNSMHIIITQMRHFHCEWKQRSGSLHVCMEGSYAKYCHIWNVNLREGFGEQVHSAWWYFREVQLHVDIQSYTSHSFLPVPSSPNLISACRQLASTHKPPGGNSGDSWSHFCPIKWRRFGWLLRWRQTGWCLALCHPLTERDRWENKVGGRERKGEDLGSQVGKDVSMGTGNRTKHRRKTFLFFYARKGT